MAKEIERKFLVHRELWQPKDEGIEIAQGYLSADKKRAVRVRLAGDRAWLTVKGPTKGVERLEFEYEIPTADARAMLALCERPWIEKRRYCEQCGAHTWEIDCFMGENEGLVVAEIELSTADEIFERPLWLGEEVSTDSRYLNASLMRLPFSRWRN